MYSASASVLAVPSAGLNTVVPGAVLTAISALPSPS